MSTKIKTAWSIHVDQDQALRAWEEQSALVKWKNEMRQTTKALIGHVLLELPVPIWNDSY